MRLGRCANSATRPKDLIVARALNILLRVPLALLLSATPFAGEAKEIVLACTNPSSGASWDSKVDFARRTVDSFPADISDQSITWEDTQTNDIYELDRASGDLTMRGASSTGGYFLYYHCHEHP